MAIDFKELEQTLGLEDGSLSSANSSEETVKVNLSHLKVFKTEDYTKLQENTALEHQQALEQKQVYSRKAATEEDTKFYRDALGLEIAGKTREQLLDAFKVKMLSGGDSTKELAEMQEKLNAHKTGLDDYKIKFQDQETKYIELENNIKTEKEASFVNSELSKALESYKDKTTLSTDDLSIIYKSKRKLVNSENGIQLFEGENQVKDEFKNPMLLEDDIATFMSPYLKQVEGGRGEGDEGNATGKMSVDRFTTAWKKANPNGLMTDFNKAMYAKQQAGEIE